MKLSYQPASVRRDENTVYYEFNTKDWHGNKVMDKLSYEESWKLLHEIGQQYKGQNVFISLSGDAVNAFDPEEMAAHRMVWNEQTKRLLEERNENLIKLEPIKTERRRLIPNCKTNSKMREALDGADEWLKEAAYSIFDKNLMPNDVGHLSVKERQELIYIGLEQAKYLAERLGNGKAGLFMDAMNTLAKYGMNGKVNEKGFVVYDVKWGNGIGRRDDEINPINYMEEISPDDYEMYLALLKENQKQNGKLSMAVFRFGWNWEANVEKNFPGAVGKIVHGIRDWMNKINNTRLESWYTSTNTTDIESFTDSIMEQSKELNKECLLENMQNFAELVAGH